MGPMSPSSAAAFPRHLSASDSVAWRIERNPQLRSTIAMVITLDRAPSHRALRAGLEAASVAFPRLRQRVVEVPLHVATPVWSNDPDFDLDFHLRFLRAGEDRSLRGVLDLAAAIAMQSFDRTRPLWEWTVVEDLDDGGAAVILKVHHALTDGVGGMRLMAELFDTERHDAAVRRVDPTVVPPAERPAATALIADGLGHQVRSAAGRAGGIARRMLGAARHPLGGAEEALQGLASAARLTAPARGPLSPLLRERSSRLHFESFSLPLADLKAAARRVDGKVNDAFLTGVAIGLRLYHELHGESPDALRVNMPINLRTDDSSLGGNNWAPARFPVPLRGARGASVDEHMRDIHDLVVRQRAEPALQFAGTLAAMLDQLPAPLLTQVFTGMLTCLDFAATNVAGAPFPLYLGGARIESMLAFAPPAGAAVNVALLSYLDTAFIGLNIDPVAVREPMALRACMERGFEMVVTPTPRPPSPQRPRRGAGRARPTHSVRG
jgi:diacylglycerol O-acyltransferase / wax synthase